MQLIFISTLYPSSVEPTRATYNRSLMTALARQGHEVRVIAPVMWCPLIDRLRGRRLPPLGEVLDGISVEHPRVLYTPGLWIHRHYLYYRWQVAGALRRECSVFSVQCSAGEGNHGSARIDTDSGGSRPMKQTRTGTGLRTTAREHVTPKPQGPASAVSAPQRDASLPHVMLGFVYPDGVAMAPICRELGLPYSIRVNGSDFRVRVHEPRFRALVLDTLHGAPLIVCPGQALKRDMVAAGIDAGNIVAFNNGVDQALFHPRPTNHTKDTKGEV